MELLASDVRIHVHQTSHTYTNMYKMYTHIYPALCLNVILRNGYHTPWQFTLQQYCIPHLVDTHGGSLGKVPLDVLQEHISSGAGDLLHLGGVESNTDIKCTGSAHRVHIIMHMPLPTTGALNEMLQGWL